MKVKAPVSTLPARHSEMDDEYIVRLEAPGIQRENLDMNVEGHVVTLSGKREFRQEHESEEFIWRERKDGRFVRSIRLPKPVDADNVTVVYQNGVLTVRLPKKEPAVNSRIAIK